MSVAGQQAKKQQQVNEKPKVKIWQIAIAGVLVVFYVGWLAHKFFGPPPQLVTAKTISDTALTAKVSKQAGPTGDLSKVNAADKAAFLKMVGGAPIAPEKILQNYWSGTH